ncbi:MAG: putative anti-sigma factor antagonist [Pseudonocardiales bacterium]|nr:putative anti-sigma factor antagonist [Pseudonocardiales bacterium]
MLKYDTGTGTATIHLAGELDLANKQSIVDGVARVASMDGVRTVALDMSRVIFLDSTALGAMISARRVCASHGCGLVVRDPSQAVTRLLRLTSTEWLFTGDMTTR